MLHLAQVEKQGLSGESSLRLIARQESGHTWAFLTGSQTIPATDADSCSDGLLVLVELSPTNQILSLKNAADWVLDLVKNYLTTGITPAFLQQEKERIEQGLQSVTVERQDLARRSIELEARREEIQELESKLQKQIQSLEADNQQLQAEIEALKAKLREQITGG